jgi:chloride channel protein, CIC family
MIELDATFSHHLLPLAQAEPTQSVRAEAISESRRPYSFATWRFHLRGESIRSAHDVGWIRNLTVGKLMRTDVRTALVEMTIAEFRQEFPLGSTQRVIIVDNTNKYAGMMIVADAHSAVTERADEGQMVVELLKYKTYCNRR